MALSDQGINEHLGLPGHALQKEFDLTQQRIDERRNKFYGKTSAVQPIDYTKLSEDGKAHRARVGSDPVATMRNVSRLDSILGKVTALRKPGRGQVLPFEEAQIIVRAIYENDLAGRERKPYWTDESFAVVDEVTKYFIGDSSGSIPLSKNLYIYGPVGVGKTYLFRMMAALCEVVPIRGMAFHMVSSKRLMRAISVSKSLKPISRIEQGNWLIDELGGEKRQAKIYAEDVDPMDQLISAVYENYIDNGKKTHWTSNKQPDELEAIYGTRNYDRICEMVEPVLFPGKSIRIDPNLTELDED